MVINHNISSMSAQNALSSTTYSMQKSIEKLSTGLRINRASDDAAGLSVSENLRAQVNGLGMADRNANDGISALQIAEGSLNQVSSILQRMRELADEGATDTMTNTDRGYINAEYTQLSSEIDRIVSVTEYNGTQLLNGAWSGKELQIGSNNSTNDRLTTTISSISTTSLGISSSQVADKSGAQSALDLIDSAIDSVNNARSNIGAYVNRLENTITNLENAELNTQSAESTIRDTDVGEEMSNYTKLQILSQAGTSMLSQANSTTSSVLALFS